MMPGDVQVLTQKVDRLEGAMQRLRNENCQLTNSNKQLCKEVTVLARKLKQQAQICKFCVQVGEPCKSEFPPWAVWQVASHWKEP